MTIYTIETGKDKKPGEPDTVGFYTSRELAERDLPEAKSIWPSAFIWDYPANEFLSGGFVGGLTSDGKPWNSR